MPVFGTNSSINASGYGFLGAKQRTIESTISPRNLTEGTQITVAVTTSGYEDGTYYYTIRGNLGTITASDFTDNSLTGTFTITNDSGSFTKTVAADGVVEEGEGFVIDIRETSHTSTVIETTQSVYIQGSTSTGVGQIDDGQGGSTFHDFGSDGNLVFDASTSTSYTYTAATDVKFKAYLWGQGGRCANNGSLGGHTYGIFNLSQGDSLHIRLNYGASNAGSGSGSGANAACGGGGLAGIFSSSTINQSNARLIAGGGGGGVASVGGSSSTNGGDGGGNTGVNGGNAGSSQINSTGGGGGSQSSGGSAGTADSSFTKSTTTTNSQSRTEAGLLHERSGGVNTTFDISAGSQATCVHQNTFEYIWTVNESYNNNNYSVSASNASSHQDYQANGTYIAAGFYAVVDNKSNNSFRVRWYRNDTNTQVNVKYHTIVVTGSRNETTSTTIPVSANGSAGSALQGGNGGNAATGFGANNAAAGGGGGAGYYGGGGGAGGNDFGDTTRAASGGGGGSGYVHSSVSGGVTGAFSLGSSHPDRGNAGDPGEDSKVVFEGITSFAYVSTSGNNETYTVNVPSNATSMTAKVWGAGGAGTGECPSNSFSGGSGGHVEGTVPVSGGTVDVFVGGSSSGSQPGQEGSGAGAGGALSAVKYSGNLLLAGGGGGAGQNGQGGGGGANGAGLNGTGPNNGTAGGAAATQNDLSNATNRSATGGLTENPACINNISGWYTRTGGDEDDPFEDIRKVVIKWDGATIGTFNDNELTSIGTTKGIAYGGYFYVPGNKAGNSAYGWCTDDSCGTCSSPSGDMCNSFDITRYTLPSGAGPGTGGSSNDRNGGNGTSWNNGSNVKDGGAAGGSGVNQGNRGGGGGAGYFGGGGGGGNSGSNCSGGAGGGGSGVISGSWTNTVSQQGQTGTGGGRSAVDNTDVDYITGYGGSGQGGLVVITFE